MPVVESSATALVRFTGLGIVCFNTERGRGEIAVIRDLNHSLAVKLRKPVFQDGSGRDTVAYKDVATYLNLPKQDVRIEIEARGNPSVEGFEIYHGDGGFDRLGDADPNDFGWIVNMNTLHGGAPVSPAGQSPHPLTKIYVSNGLFYTHRLDTNLFFEKVERDAAGRETGREVFGNVGETVGVRVEGDEVVFRLSADGRQESHTLKRVEGLPFVIEIENMDRSPNAVYSDMPDYYRFLASPDGRQFEFEPVREEGDEEGAGGAVNQEEFCHPIATDLQSVDQL